MGRALLAHGSRVICTLCEEQKTNDAGLVLPDGTTTAGEGLSWYEVVSVGPGSTLQNGVRNDMDIQRGDRILSFAPEVFKPTCEFVNPHARDGRRWFAIMEGLVLVIDREV